MAPIIQGEFVRYGQSEINIYADFQGASFIGEFLKLRFLSARMGYKRSF